MKQYFFNDNSISKIRKIESCYREIRNKIRDISGIVVNNVCINGVWFDDNAIVFGKWWNDNGHDYIDGSVFGNLKWDESQNRLVSDTTSVTTDGVDRLYKILKRGGKIFYIAVCKSLAALASSHREVKNNKCRIYVQAAQNKKYNLSAKGDIWYSDLMCNELHIVSKKTWIDVQIPSNSNGKTTSVVRLQNFQKEMKTNLDKLDEAVNNYCTEIESLVNNKDSSQWWGFSDDIRSQVKKAVKSYRTSSEKKMKNFKRNLNLAISKTIEAKGKDLEQIMEVDMLSDLE